MPIEEELQSTFKSEYHRLVVNIMFTQGWVLRAFNRHLKPFGISFQQYNILRILRGQHPNPATVSLLIERMIDKSSNASRLVEKLRGKGLVERIVSGADRRCVDVRITTEGLDLIRRIELRDAEWEFQLKNLSEAEAKQMNGFLDKLRG
jgi:DNA-binding MarR family transcriptional regulator